jgi:ankyrin repeat protein
VFLAERPLTIDELRHALSIRPADDCFDEDGIPTLKSILDSCLGLVTVDECTSSLRLVHKSLQDFLERQYGLGMVFQEGQKDIARTCLTYMGFSMSQHSATSDPERNVLHRYTILNWGHHVRKSQYDYNSWKAVASLLAARGKMAYVFLPWEPLRQYVWAVLKQLGQSDILHIVIHFGLTGPTEFILYNWNIDIHHELPIRIDRHIYVFTPLLRAVHSGSTGTMRLLLQKGADTEREDPNLKQTALCWAVTLNQKEAVELLIEEGAKLEPKGRKPLLLAIVKRNKALVELLLDAGASVEARKSHRQTPLMRAVSLGDLDIIRLLVEKGPHAIDYKDKSGRTALSRVCEEGYLEMAQVLLEHGADIESRDMDDRTALLYAAKMGPKAIVQLLLDKNADLEAKDNTGRTYLSWALAWNNFENAILLMESGADPESRDNNGLRPLDWIVGDARRQILEYGEQIPHELVNRKEN